MMDDMASAMGDTCRCPLGASQQKLSLKKRYHITTLFAMSITSNAKECVQATQVVLDLEMEVQAKEMECQTRHHIPPLTIPALRKIPIRCRNQRRRRRGQAPFRTLVATITPVLCSWNKVLYHWKRTGQLQ